MNAHETHAAAPAGARPIPWAEYRRIALIAGAAGLGLSALSGFLGARWFFPSYLVAFLFWTGIGVGSLAALLLHYLVGGPWGFLIRRPLEAAVMTLPVMALLFLPLLLGLGTLYPWSRPGSGLGPKLQYLNVTWFLARTAVYFVLWCGLALAFNRGSRAQDRTADPSITWRLQMVAAPGLVAVFLSVTFAAVDWGMSIEPRWYSTIYGPMIFVGFVLSALATMVLVASRLADVPPLSGIARPVAFHEVGNLLLAFTMLWAYMSFSQYLITWNGNTAEEIPWYLTRSRGLWRGVAASLIFLHFFLPFFYLLFRENKRDYRRLRLVAAWLLALHVVNDCWLILPAFSPNVLAHWAFVPAFVGVGGAWAAAFLWQLEGRPLLPQNDPLLADVLEHHPEELH